LLQNSFPALVRYDPTPIHKALWRIATQCTVVSQWEGSGGYFYQSQPSR